MEIYIYSCYGNENTALVVFQKGCNNGEIGLVGGSSIWEGTVEICYDNA